MPAGGRRDLRPIPNDIDAFHPTADADARPVGTSVVCHEFKGGIGISSRRVETAGSTYTVGALVQANHGARELPRLDGRPTGTLCAAETMTGQRGPTEHAIPHGRLVALL